jgi:hypothetical protein
MCYAPWVMRAVSAYRCLRRAAVTVARAMPRRRRTQPRVRARPSSAEVVLHGVPVGSYLLEQRGRQRVLWLVGPDLSGDEVL